MKRKLAFILAGILTINSTGIVYADPDLTGTAGVAEETEIDITGISDVTELIDTTDNAELSSETNIDLIADDDSGSEIELIDQGTDTDNVILAAGYEANRVCDFVYDGEPINEEKIRNSYKVYKSDVGIITKYDVKYDVEGSMDAGSVYTIKLSEPGAAYPFYTEKVTVQKADLANLSLSTDFEAEYSGISVRPTAAELGDVSTGLGIYATPLTSGDYAIKGYRENKDAGIGYVIIKATNSKNKVMRIAHVLQNKATIPAVQANMPLLLEVSNPKFWGSVTIDRLETVREALRELVYILMNDRIHGRFPIDVSDTYEGKDDVDKPVMYSDYRTRILDYLNEHRDLEVIQKIFHLEQLTIDDIKELEEICWKELGSKEEYEAYVNKGFMLCGDKVAVFIRSIIGVDRKIAKERFSKFLSDNVLNSLQEEYINQIIGYVCENGDITPMTIITNDNFEGIDKAFGVNMVSIKNYVEELHDVIVYQTGTGPVYVGRPHPVFEEEDHGLMAAEDRDLPE